LSSDPAHAGVERKAAQNRLDAAACQRQTERSETTRPASGNRVGNRFCICSSTYRSISSCEENAIASSSIFLASPTSAARITLFTLDVGRVHGERIEPEREQDEDVGGIARHLPAHRALDPGRLRAFH